MLVLPLQLLLGMLIREVPCRRPTRELAVGKLMAATLASLIVAGLVVGPRAFRRQACFGESKVDIARVTVLKYAYEAYPSWRSAHPDQTCPSQLVELNSYMNNRETKDPYGNDYELYCGPGGIIVRSLGEDSRPNTADDLWSNP